VPNDVFTPLQRLLSHFYEERDWGQFQTLKDIAGAAGIEAGELQEHFLWLRPEQESAVLEERRDEVEGELADLLINCLNFARLAGVDLDRALRRKLKQLERKYPVEAVRGRVIPPG